MGITYKVTIDKKDVEGLVDALKKAGSKGKLVVQNEMISSGESIASNMKGRTPRATGRLADSIEVDEGEISQNRVRIGPTEEYGLYQEEGSTGQRLPPISKIEKWAKIKGLSDPSGKGSGAIFIAKKIANTGYKAQKFVQKTEGYARNSFNKHIEIAVQKITQIVGS